MKFCRNCGEEIKKDAKFCKYCGYNFEPENQGDQEEKIHKESSLKEEETNKSTPAEKPKEQIKMSKKNKILIGIVSAIIIFLFIGYKVGDSLTSHAKTVEKFETALIEKDAKTLGNLLTSEAKDLKINKDTVKGFIDYYTNNPSEMNGLFNHLKQQGEEYDHNKDYDGMNSDYIVNLIKDGKTFIYDDYQIKVTPVYFEVGTNYSDTNIAIDGEEVFTTTAEDSYKEFGPYLPGTYQFSAVYKSDFIELSTEETFTNFDPGYSSEVYLHIDGEEANFEVPYSDELEDIGLYINGEETDVNLIEQDTIGPVLVDSSMNVSFEADFPWGTMKTEEMPLDDSYMYVDFPLTDEMKEEINDTIIKYSKEYLAAYTTADSSHLTVATNELTEDIIDKAESEKEYEYFYKGKFIGTDFVNNSYSLSSNDGFFITVDASVIHEEDSRYNTHREPELKESEEATTYELVYDTEKEAWLVSYLDWGYFDKDDDMIEYREEDPEIYTSEWESFEDDE